MTSTSSYTNVDFFSDLGKLPPEVITLIIDNIPKCMLPQLLYFPPIRKAVASSILSNVNITIPEEVGRHEWSDEPGVGYSRCKCDVFDIEFSDFKEGITQWHVYPKIFSMEYINNFKTIWDTFPQMITNALSIKGFFLWEDDSDTENDIHTGDDMHTKDLLKFFADSNIKFDSLNLAEFPGPITLPPITTNLLLLRTTLTSYEIPGLKKLEVDLYCAGEQNQSYTFTSDLEDLTIEDRHFIQMTLPSSLRRLSINTDMVSVNIISEELVNLEYLELKNLRIPFINEIGIVAPNLKTLDLEECRNTINLYGLREFQKLKHLSLKQCAYPIGLFEENFFPELESFEFSGKNSFERENAYRGSLKFPANLKRLSIKWANHITIDLRTFILPPQLKHLELLDVNFSNEPLKFSEKLEYVRICTPVFIFPGNFRIPPLMKHFQIQANRLVFPSSQFMYSLPDGLELLQLLSSEKGKLSQLTQKVNWPKSLKVFGIRRLRLHSHSLELWNFHESNLEEIDIQGGTLDQLNADALPTSLVVLTLQNLQMQKLRGSFENLKNLQELTLVHNNLENKTHMKFPSLKFLDLGYCKFDLIPPVSVSLIKERRSLLTLESASIDVVILQEDTCITQKPKRIKI